MKNRRVKMLEEMEKDHWNAIEHIRALIKAEGGRQAADVSSAEKNGASRPEKKQFAAMTKGEAVRALLTEKGPMKSSEIYKTMKRRGHPVASRSALSNLLSTDERFERKTNGTWGLSIFAG